MVRLAAEKATEHDIEQLYLRHEEQRVTLENSEQFMKHDMLFHREIARISRNPIFPAIVEALFGWASAYYQSIVHAPGAESLTLAEHKKIIEAIAAHDGEGAVQAMRDHLNRANELYKTALRQQ
jgi:DNA-binding FadR family transcriptional regulator